MSENFQIQNWDTDFFGFKVAKMKNDMLINKEHCEDILYELNKENVHLAYYFTNKQLDSSASEISKYYFFDFILTRIPLILELNREFDFHENVSVYKERDVLEPLIDLAVLAGSKGRFGCDQRISKNDCDGIFKSWINNAIANKEGVLVYKINSEIVGMVSFNIRDKIGYGGLLAVYPEFEGKGISFALLQAMMNLLQHKGCDYFYSGTQKLNKKALKVFERFGLIPQKPEYVYHLWKK